MMQQPQSMRQGILLMVSVILAGASVAFSQEVEPNNTCLSAQDIGAITLPFTLNGSVETLPGNPDIDYFIVRGTPDTPVQVDVEGAGAVSSLLTDPILAAFDGGCTRRIAFNDDGGVAFNSRMGLLLPADGVLVLAVASFDDGVFPSQPGGGSYQLTIMPVIPAGAISGRIVNASTGEPLSGAEVNILSCVDNQCEDTDVVTFQEADNEGRFTTAETVDGNFLLPGTYMVVSIAEGFDIGLTEPFSLGPEEDRDVGDIRLAPLSATAADARLYNDLQIAKGMYSYKTLRDRQRHKLKSE